MATNRRVLVLKNFEKPKQGGVHYRLLCLTGDHKGESYFLTGERITIGRGDNCDIQIEDVKASREHAELKKVGDQYIASDLGSQNGIIINDQKVAQHLFVDEDKLIVGKTVFKFNVINVHKEETKIGITSGFGGDDRATKKEVPLDDDAKKKKKNRTIIVAVALLLVGAFLGPWDDQSTDKIKSGNSNKVVPKDIDVLLEEKQEKEDAELQHNLSNIFQRGLREEREGNYFRATQEFNLALILSPRNGRAEYYLKRTKQKMDKEIEALFLNATRHREALRYQQAIEQYCTIMRSLQQNPDDDRYKRANDSVHDLEKILGMEEGATKCL